MNRRAFISALLLAPLALADEPRADVLLVGDSLAFGLGPALRPFVKRGEVFRVNARGGTSARQWLRKRWLAAT